MAQEGLSHLEFIFHNDVIRSVVRKLEYAYERGGVVVLEDDEIANVRSAYAQEMIEAEARTHVLVQTLMGRFWHNTKVNCSMNLEGMCLHKYHQDPIVVVNDLTKDHLNILVSTEDELITQIVRQNPSLMTCSTHKTPVEVDRTFLGYSPYDQVLRVINSPASRLEEAVKEDGRIRKCQVIAITSRIKSPGDLADKITDKIFNIDAIAKREKIPSPDNQVNDLSGVRIITSGVEICYLVLTYLKNSHHIKILEEKDYFKKPKNEGKGYHGLNVTIVYGGLRHEVQIMDAASFDHNRFSPYAAHKKWKETVREAREQVGRPWYELNRDIRKLLTRDYVKNGVDHK